MKSFDKKNFVQTWVNRDQYYVVGYDKSNNKKVLAVTVTWIAWYEIYFRITEEEYEWHKSDLSALNDLAQRMSIDKGIKYYKDRLLSNEGPR